MASILRQIVAGPRARHPEAGLDLCYVTDHIIATSGPSQTYPQRAYRNPLDHLVAFLDDKHGDDWAIWEFRAEGTGYPDSLVYGRIRHYPFPDHHPPPFRLMPMILASMRNWLHGGDLDVGEGKADRSGSSNSIDDKELERRRKKRVVVVHCKAGKGRSGTVSCSYLIAEEGWKAEDALARFTERRMRPKFGGGVTIPSQLRWVSYIDRWANKTVDGRRRYVDRPIEIVELHIQGLRNGVKVDVRGFADEGKRIEILHTFKKDERVLVAEGAPETGGLGEMVWEMAGYSMSPREKAPEEADMADSTNLEVPKQPERVGSAPPLRNASQKLRRKGNELVKKVSPSPSQSSKRSPSKSKTFAGDGDDSPQASDEPLSDEPPRMEPSEGPEPGGMSVILRPKEPIRVSNSDVNVAVELRNRAHRNIGLTMVSAVAHVWFNAYFEGKGPEQEGRADDSGVFSIAWEAMDGIKGSSRKGVRALDRLSVVWRVADLDADAEKRGPGEAARGEEVDEPDEGQPVPQMEPADWTGANSGDNNGSANGTGDVAEADLGLRTQSPASADVSKASSVRSVEGATCKPVDASDGASIEGVKSSGPGGEDLGDAGKGGKRKKQAKEEEEEEEAGGPAGGPAGGDDEMETDVLEQPDRASGTTKKGSTKIV